MSELHQLADSWDNGVYPEEKPSFFTPFGQITEEDELFVLPVSPLLEESDEDEGDDEEWWWMPSAEERRPHAPSLPCPHPGCRGGLYAEVAQPGVSTLRCTQCSREIGEALHTDLQRWVGAGGMVHIETHAESLLWVRS